MKKKGEILKSAKGEYKLLDDWRILGGLSQVTFAEHKGNKVFLKQFLKPKYPGKSYPGSEEGKKKQLKKCTFFENHHIKIAKAIEGTSSGAGNLVVAYDFFKEKDGSIYYKVYKYIDHDNLSVGDISKLSFKGKIELLKSISNTLSALHNNGIVHGDLKPDNILLEKSSSGKYIAKLIDFDNAYFEGKPPKGILSGTPEFLSPELSLFHEDDESVKQSDLTCKSDIFTLGIVFSQYLTGHLPISNKLPPYEHIRKGNIVEIELTPELKEKPGLVGLINSMLIADSDKRPTISSIKSKLTFGFHSVIETPVVKKDIKVKSNFGVKKKKEGAEKKTEIKIKGLGNFGKKK